MKAVKSDLAKRLLADPSARVQMRNSAAAESGGDTGGSTAVRRMAPVVVREQGRQVRYLRVVVPKAA